MRGANRGQTGGVLAYSTQVQVVDNVEKHSTFGKIFRAAMAVTALAGGSVSEASYWTTEMEEVARKEQQDRRQRAEVGKRNRG